MAQQICMSPQCLWIYSSLESHKLLLPSQGLHQKQVWALYYSPPSSWMLFESVTPEYVRTNSFIYNNDISILPYIVISSVVALNRNIYKWYTINCSFILPKLILCWVFSQCAKWSKSTLIWDFMTFFCIEQLQILASLHRTVTDIS